MYDTVAAAAAAIVLIGTAAAGWAEPPSDRPARPFEWQETFAWGIAEHELDADTEVTGWRLNRHWYLGRRSGDDALSLTWQGNSDQVTISTDGIRFTRRF